MIYVHQASDVYCMHTHDLLRGLRVLGFDVESNILNYDWLLPRSGKKPEATLVTTSGNDTTDYYPDGTYAFIDGRDYMEIDNRQMSKASYYFKTNSISPDVIQLPSCVDPGWLSPPSHQRSEAITFYSGHSGLGRDRVRAWVESIDGRTEPILDDIVPLNPRYPTGDCNTYSKHYHDALTDSLISVNAPGGGVNTKKFFEIIAAGCVVLNYVPTDYHQETSNILDIIPLELNFPYDAVVNFSTEAELWDAINNTPISYADKTYNWAQSWGFKEKAAYVLKTIW